jgi:hypothetical protein
VLQLREFHLEFAFEAPRTLGENIEDKSTTIQYPTLQQCLEIAFLGRRQFMVEDDHLCLRLVHRAAHFFGFATTDKQAWIGYTTLACYKPYALCSGRGGEFLEFLQIS